MQEACTLTWDEPPHCSQPRSFFQLWQGAETSCFLSHFQMALLILHGEGWMPSSSFLGAELARFCPLSAPLAGGGGGGGGGGTERGGRGGVWKGQEQSAAPGEEEWMEPPSLLHGAPLARKDGRKVSV